MKNLLLTLLTILSIQYAYAQFPGGPPGGGSGEGRRSNQNNQPGMMMNGGQQAKGIGKITGTIVDSVSGKGVEFANVALYNKATNKLVDGAVADEKGKFAIEGLVDGTYQLKISFLGYSNKLVDDIKMVREKTINLGNIQLSEGNQTLQEVTVTGQKAMIEEKVDRLVYNAEKDQLAKGGDAADVLRKVPLLQVDLEGNVSVRGSSNIKVLINNKPSTIMASSVADALKQIPADMIKTVEVITSPTAKYDAEGSAGIINIITKKDKLEGYRLNVDMGAGIRGSNLGLNGSLRTGKFGLTLGGFGRAFYNKAETDMEQKTLVNGINNTTKQFADASDNGLHGNYTLGMDYDIDKTQSLTGNVRYGLRNFSRDQLQTTNLFADNILKSTFLRDIRSTDASNNIDVNIDYIKTFKPQQEWSISSQYSRNDLTNNFSSDDLNDNGAVISRLKNINDNLNQEITFQSDYQTPIGDNQMIEFGGKGIFRKVNSDYSYLSAKDAIADYTLDFNRPAGTLNYGQNVASAYTSYTVSTKNKYTFKMGARLEHTAINATQDNKDINIPDYSNLVPSLNISKSLKGASTLKLGYNRRIQRPGLQQLNPNFNVSNSQDIRVGNPNLRPELTDNIELGLSTMIKKTYINASIFTRVTNNAINQVRRPIDSVAGAILTTFENIGKQQAIGTNLFTNIYLTNNWSINGGVDMFYSFLEGQTTGLDGKSVTVKNSGMNFGGRLMTQVTLKNGWGFQAFSFVRGQQVELQGTRGGFGMYSLGVRKDFKNKKGSVGLAGENFFTRGWNVKSTLTSPQFTQTSNMLLINRNVKLTFSYKFGKMTFVDARKKTRSVNNDDIKQGGDGGEGGGGMQQGQQGGQGGGGSRPMPAGGAAPQNGQKPQGAPQNGPQMKQGGNPQQKPQTKPGDNPTKNTQEEPKKQ